jgi:hypothetical protein
MDVMLNASEIAKIDKQDPARAGDGGYQSLLVGLQNKINRETGQIRLSADDIRRIQMYAFRYGNGGWEDRLVGAFSRTLGPRLDGTAN